MGSCSMGVAEPQRRWAVKQIRCRLQRMEPIPSVDENVSKQMMMYNPCSIQIVDTKTVGRGCPNPSLVCSFPQVKQTRRRLQQVKSISSVKEDVSERVTMDNPSSQRSTSVSSFTIPFQPISGQCSFQHLGWNNLRWVDEVDTKHAEDSWENFERPSMDDAEVRTITELIEMDVICNTSDH